MINIKSKAQSWSIDITLGIIIFVAAFLIFYTLLNANPNTKVRTLKDEASTIIKQIASEEASIKIVDNNNEINLSRAGKLKNLNYDELKRRLRVEDDFCIFFEDQQGDIILINNSYRGIGAPTINVGGVPCSQK